MEGFGKMVSVAGESRARPGNLSQASRTRLSESGGGSPKPFFSQGRLGGQLCNFERADNSPRREGSRLSEIPRCPYSCFVPSPRRKGGLA